LLTNGVSPESRPPDVEESVEVRCFVVEDPALRNVAIMGYGPARVVVPESDVILDAVARNLKMFEESRRAA
jgi:hypothetical protein